MAATDGRLRVGVYGSGGWARRTHIPNLLRLGVDVVAVCDVDLEAARQAAAQLGRPATYADGYRMVAEAQLDVLYSCVPAYARTGVEAAAARAGIHLFSEKPQATSMAVARAIAAAVAEGGVLSTVCFRERYRPLFQEAKRRLAGKAVVHARFQSIGGLPARCGPADGHWSQSLEKAGGGAFDWGVHAVDYLRFLTGLDVATSQAFYHEPAGFASALSSSLHLVFANGATATLTFVAATPSAPPGEPWFAVFYEGGYLALYGYERLEENGHVVYTAGEFDPWFEQDRVFVDAVRTGDGAGLLNDYADGLKSLAPVLAGWHSAKRGGRPVDVAAYAAA